VVFCTVDSDVDAEGIAQMAVMHALSGGTPGERRYARLGVEWPVEVGFTRPSDGAPFMATVHDVREAGAAAGNGYLWLHPTSVAYRGVGS
jgi:hypothetical protein